MFRKILVPLDGSTFAELAVPRALELATRAEGTVHLVHVAKVAEEPARRNRASGQGSATVDRSELVRTAEEYLDGVATRIAARSPEIEVTGQVLPAGNVVSSLVHEMAAEEIDLVVMSTHGRGPARRAWLGSVADGVVRQTPRPVLLIRPRAGSADDTPDEPIEAEVPPFGHLLVPLDGSMDAEEAVPHARELARTEGAAITLASIVPPVGGGAFPFVSVPARGSGTDVEDAVAIARDRLEEIAAELREADLDVAVEVVRRDRPAMAILDLAAREEVDLIVMTTRGRGGVARFVIGSVADKVIRGAAAPVLVHRPRRREEE